MPIEIKELIIRTSVTDDATSTQNVELEESSKHAIVNACVEHVMELLKEKGDR